MKMISTISRTFRYLLMFIVISAPLTLTPGIAGAAEMVDINRADAATMIANWKGIGEKKAKAIVAYRKKHGPFASINDLANVKGIGEGLIKNNRKYMSVKGGAKTTQSTAKKSTKKSTSKATGAKDKKADKKTSKSKTTKKTDKSKSSTKKTDKSKSSGKNSTSKKSTSKKSSTKKKKKASTTKK